MGIGDGRCVQRRAGRQHRGALEGLTIATTIHLVRHAAHGLLGHVLAGRMPGVSLSDAGRGQTARLASGFAPGQIQRVVSSPLDRARETAGPIAAAQGLVVEFDDDLVEIDFGQWTGLGFDALHRLPEWQAWNQLRSLSIVPGGESMAQAQSRALAAIVRIRSAVPDGEVVIVSHSDLLKSILAHALGVPLDLMQRIELDPASRSVIVLHEFDVRVLGVNLSAPVST